MRKAGTISYKIDLKTSEVVFNYRGEEVRLGIEMGQSARGLILSYTTKLERGTTVRKGKSKNSYEDNQILTVIIQLHRELQKDNVVKLGTLKILKILCDVEGVNESLKLDTLKLINNLEPKYYNISKENSNKLNHAKLNNKKAYNSMLAVLSDEINLFQSEKQKDLVMIADMYELHKDKLIITEPRQITTPAQPMHLWR